MARTSRFAQLYAKKLRGGLPPQEQEELDKLIREFPEYQLFLETPMDPTTFARGRSILLEMDKDSLKRKMKQAIEDTRTYDGPTPRRRIRTRVLRWTAAPLAIGLLTLVLCVWPPHKGFSKNRTEARENWLKNSPMAKNAGFTIDNESSILLDSMQEGRTLHHGSIDITRMGLHDLVVRWADIIGNANETPGSEGETSVNTAFFIPLQEDIWQLTLPDSSRITLYPGSSLAVSIKAIGLTTLQRVMTLNGQAFFKITPNANAPLYIETTRGETKVLGTSFCIRDYGKEDSLSLSLDQGQLTICNGKTTKSLDPMHQAVVRDGTDIEIRKRTSPPDNIALDEDHFDFSNKDLSEAMEEIARHYGMTNVVFQNVDTAIKGTVLDGQPEKSLTIDQLLGILDRDDLHFKRNGKTIFVWKPKTK